MARGDKAIRKRFRFLPRFTHALAFCRGVKAPAFKSVDGAAVKHIEAPASRDAADHVIEDIWLGTVRATGGLKMGRKIGRVEQGGGACAGIEGKLGGELRQPHRLHAPWLDPDKRAAVGHLPDFEAVKGRWQKALRRPEPDMRHVGHRDKARHEFIYICAE